MPKSKWGSSSGASGGSIPSESWRLLWRLIFIIAGPALLAPPASSSATRARNSAFSFLNHTESFQSRLAEAYCQVGPAFASWLTCSSPVRWTWPPPCVAGGCWPSEAPQWSPCRPDLDENNWWKNNLWFYGIYVTRMKIKDIQEVRNYLNSLWHLSAGSGIADFTLLHRKDLKYRYIIPIVTSYHV